MLVFKVLHILSMFTAVTFLMGDALFIALAFWRRDVRALAAFQRLVGYRQTVIGASRPRNETSPPRATPG